MITKILIGSLFFIGMIHFGDNYVNGIKQKQEIDKTLRFKNRKFKILIFTDTHYGETEEKDVKTMNVQDKILKFVKPDMAIITGDGISGFAWDKKEIGFYKRNWKKMTQCFKDYKTLYAFVQGNHDHQADLSWTDIMELDKTHPYSLFNGTYDIEKEGASNYILEIKSSIEGKEDKTSTLLWMIDTKDTQCLSQKESWGCISQAQIDWYKIKYSELEQKYQQKVNGFSFFHIPIPEFMHLWNFKKTQGLKAEQVCCPAINTGFFENVIQQNNIKGIFCGHDHDNDYSGFYEGVELVYNRKTGYGCYGPTGQRGARVLEITEFLNDNGDLDFNYEHFIVQEDLSIVPNIEPKWQGDKQFQTLCKF